MATKKTSLFPLFLTVFIDMLGIGIIIPVLPPLLFNPAYQLAPLAATMEWRNMIFGFLMAAYPLAQFFGAPIIGALADRYGRKKLLVLSLIGTAIGYALFAYGIVTHQLWLLFFARALDGFTGGNISVVYSMIADISDHKSKAKNFGLIGMAFGLGFILGPYIGAKLADPTIVSWFTSDTPFWFAVGLTAINIVLVMIRVTETLHANHHIPISVLTGISNIKKAFQMKNIRSILIIFFLFTFGFNFFTQFFQVYLFTKFQFTQSQVGDFFSYVGIWIAVAQGAIVRPLAKKFSSQQIVRVSLIGLGIALTCLLIPDHAIWLYVVIPFVALFNGLSMPNLTALLSNSASAKEQGEILGIQQSMQALGAAIPPIIAGFITSLNINLPITAAAISIGLAWLVFMFFFKPAPQIHTEKSAL